MALLFGWWQKHTNSYMWDTCTKSRHYKYAHCTFMLPHWFLRFIVLVWLKRNKQLVACSKIDTHLYMIIVHAIWTISEACLTATVEKLLSIILKIYAAALTPSWNEPDIQCVEGVPLWRGSASIINHEFLKGYRQRGGEINEFIAGYISLCYIFFLFEVWRNKMT